MVLVVKNSPANDPWEDPLEEEMATQFSVLAWRILWTEETGGLQSIGSQRVRHDCTMSLTFFLSIVPFGEGNGNPFQCSCLEDPMDRGAWWATVYGVAESQSQLSN